MYLLVAAILCLTAVPVTPNHHEIHKRMTPVQVQQVFGTTHENIPSYKLVNVEVSSMQKRDTQYRRSVRIHGAGRDMNLVLGPSDGFLAGENTPVTEAVVSGDDVIYRNYRDVMKRVGEQLVDPITGSSLVLSRNRNRRYALDGNIESENLVIRSLPEEIVDSLYPNNLNHHVIFEPMMEPFKPDHAYNLLNVTQLRLALSRNTGSVPHIIFPELLLVVDASSFKLHGSDVIRTVRYILILWNSVDMRYRNLRSPIVRLNIARIIIAEEPKGTPYINSSIVNGNVVEADKVLEKASQHFYSQRTSIPLNSYDAILAMTQHKLVNQNKTIVGLAHYAGACTDPYRQSVYRAAIFNDDGTHWSSTPAHELAHLLGAQHDDSICSAEDGYIMTPRSKSSINNWDFSTCSIRDIQNITQLNPQCLVNAPRNAGKVLPTVVMDKSETVAEQCRLAIGTEPCDFDAVEKEEFCRTLSCKHPTKIDTCRLLSEHNLADGTPCDNGKRCIRGECVIG